MDESREKMYLIDVLMELVGKKRSELTQKVRLLHAYEVAGICIVEARLLKGAYEKCKVRIAELEESIESIQQPNLPLFYHKETEK